MAAPLANRTLEERRAAILNSFSVIGRGAHSRIVQSNVNTSNRRYVLKTGKRPKRTWTTGDIDRSQTAC